MCLVMYDEVAPPAILNLFYDSTSQHFTTSCPVLSCPSFPRPRHLLQIAFTRALSNQLVSQGIRVNAVAPGPIWTPLIPATFPKVRYLATASFALYMTRNVHIVNGMRVQCLAHG